MSITVILKATGLSTSPNPLNVPDGSCSVASNVVINRADVYESRRGYKLYGQSFGSSTDTAKQLLVYKNRILRHHDTTLSWDTDEADFDEEQIFDDFDGDYEEPDSGLRMRGVESNGNFYFTSAEGIKKISATEADDFTTDAGYITQAGQSKAIDLQARVNVSLGEQSNFFEQDSVAAYRAVWGKRDANNNLNLSAPSQRIEVYNPLLSLIQRDFLRLLNALDDLNVSGSLITDGTYLNTHKVLSTDSASTLRTKLIALASQLDQDIELASDIGTGAGCDIDNSDITMSGTTAVVTPSAGSAPNVLFALGDVINVLEAYTMSAGADIPIGQYTITAVDATTFSFVVPGTTNGATNNADDGGVIESYNYRSIDEPSAPSITPTNGEILELQDYLDAIIARLQSEGTGVVSAVLAARYIDPLDITTSSTVLLDVTIPDGVTTDNFLQLYRSALQTAVSTDTFSDLAASDDLALVYEAYPTDDEITAGVMDPIEDTVLDVFRGALLYTNANSGETILGANDIPPFAKDINKFKNHTFYANTRTRHNKQIALLGVSAFYYSGSITANTVAGDTVISSLAHGLSTNDVVIIEGSNCIPSIDGIRTVTATTTDTFTIAPAVTTAGTSGTWFKNKNPKLFLGTETLGHTYSFTVGAREVTNITCCAATHFVAGAATASYWLVNSANDETEYYVWYYVNAGSMTDPVVSGKTGIKVVVNAADTAATVAEKTRNALNTKLFDFTAQIGSSGVVNLITVGVGYTTNATAASGTIGAAPVANSFAVAIDSEGQGEKVSTREVLLSTSSSPATAVTDTANSLVRCVNQSSTETLYGYYLSSSIDVPGKMNFESRELDEEAFYAVTNGTDATDSFGYSFNPILSPTNSITSVSVANPTVITSASHGLSDGDQILIAGSGSTPTIDGIRTVSNSATTFTVPVNVTVGGATTSTSFILLSDAVSSSNDSKPNRLYYSKLQQPEAVPLLNYFDVGSESHAILRIFPLRDSLFVFKKDGLYRVSGETTPFSLSLFDSSCILLAPDTLDVANNILFGWTKQGIAAVTEGGVSIISSQIDSDIMQFQSSNYPNFINAAFGLGYESDSAYLVWCPALPADEVGTICYRYDNLSQTWTTFDKTNTCGVINPEDDKMYLGAGDTNYLEQERKSFARTDFTDRRHDFTLSSGDYVNDGLGIRLSSVSELDEDDVIVQEQLVTFYEFNQTLTKLDDDPSVTDTNYRELLEASGGDNLRDKLANSSVTVGLAAKLDADSGVSGTSYRSSIASVSSAAITANTVASSTVITSASHGLLTGRLITITGSTTSSPSLNGSHVVTVINANTFSIPITVVTAGTNGTFSTIDSDFRDIKVCYNHIINTLNSDTGVAYSNYMLNSTTNIQETDITAINSNNKICTVSRELPFMAGAISVYKGIPCEIVYNPMHMGDPVSWKHLNRAEVFFESKAFTRAILSFGTDLVPGFSSVTFNGEGNGIFGYRSFGSGLFGGGGTATPFSTIIPRNSQRCRFIVLKFEHSVARENFLLTGIAVIGRNQVSTKAYRS